MIEKPKLCFMKQTYLSSLFSMLAQITSAISATGKQKYDNTHPGISQVGIKFDNISVGKLYPEIPVLKNIIDLRQKDVTSHL
jgi:hypothetical protein